MEERFDIYFDATYLSENNLMLESISEYCPLTQLEHHVEVDAHKRNLKGNFEHYNYMYKLFQYTGEMHPMGFEDTEPISWEEIFSNCDECNSYTLDHDLYNGLCEYCNEDLS